MPVAINSAAVNTSTLEADRPSTDPRPKVYDRSSFEGDFLIAIPGQTAEDFERFAPETRICEYFDGTVYMPSPVSDDHQYLVVFLTHLLDAYRWERGTGKVVTGPGVLRLRPEYKPEPDIHVRPIDDDSGTKAVLVIEVLSAGHVSYDLEFKDAFYREAGIPEIWYIDQRERRLIARRKLGDTYRTDEYAEGPVHATGIPGFWIDVSWLWASPEANPRECLARILAGPPVVTPGPTPDPA